MSSLGDDTATFNIIVVPEAVALPSNLPYNQPMSDDEWKAVVIAAMHPHPSAIKHPATTIDTPGTAPHFTTGGFQQQELLVSSPPTQTSFLRMVEDEYSVQQQIVGIINEEEDPLIKVSPGDEQVETDKTKRSSRKTDPETEKQKDTRRGVDKKKKRKITKKQEGSKTNSRRSERRTSHERRSRKKLPEEEGSSSLLSFSDPSSSSRTDHGDNSKKRVKKKSRKTRSSSPRRRSTREGTGTGTSHRRRSRSRHARASRKSVTSPVTRKEGERARSRSRTHRREKRSTSEQRRSGSVDPKEIMDFLSNSKSRLSGVKSSSAKVLPSPRSVKPARRNDAGVFPEAKNNKRGDALRLSNKIDRGVFLDGKHKGSLEFAIASKPKSRGAKETDISNQRNRGQPRVLLQKVWDGIRSRGDKMNSNTE